MPSAKQGSCGCPFSGTLGFQRVVLQIASGISKNTASGSKDYLLKQNCFQELKTISNSLASFDCNVFEIGFGHLDRNGCTPKKVFWGKK